MEIKIYFKCREYDEIRLSHESIDDDPDPGVAVSLISNSTPEKAQHLIFSRSEAIEMVRALSAMLIKDTLIVDVSEGKMGK